MTTKFGQALKTYTRDKAKDAHDFGPDRALNSAAAQELRQHPESKVAQHTLIRTLPCWEETGHTCHDCGQPLTFRDMGALYIANSPAQIRAGTNGYYHWSCWVGGTS